MPRPWLPSFYSDRSVDVTDEFEFTTVGEYSRRSSLLSELDNSYDAASEYDNNSVNEYAACLNDTLEEPRVANYEGFTTILLESDLSLFETPRGGSAPQISIGEQFLTLENQFGYPNWQLCSTDLDSRIQDGSLRHQFTFSLAYPEYLAQYSKNQDPSSKYSCLICIQIILFLVFIFIVCFLMATSDLLDY